MRTLDMYDNIIAAICVWRETRGEDLLVKILVAKVLVNRTRDKLDRWPKTLSSVVLQPYQFSSFNTNDPNSSKIPRQIDLSLVSCCTAVDAALDDSIPFSDSKILPTISMDEFSKLSTANHYHDDSIAPPSWTKGMEFLGKVGRILFYRG